MYYDGYGQEGKKAIMGALTLYLDFINLFIMLINYLVKEDNIKVCSFVGLNP